MPEPGPPGSHSFIVLETPYTYEHATGAIPAGGKNCTGSGYEVLEDEQEKQERWRRYFEITDKRPVDQIFNRLEPFLPDAGTAIDLGCGAGRGTIWLLERGLRVIAVDVAAEALDHLRRKLPDGADVELVHLKFQEFEPAPCDVAVASYTLFFLAPDEFADFWPKLVEAIRPGGLFAGEFLGENDSWTDRGLTMASRATVDDWMKPFEVLYLEEEEKDGETALGEQKHWHVFHVIGRKH